MARTVRGVSFVGGALLSIVATVDRRASAQDGYTGNAYTGEMAAQAPDWLIEGLAAPPRYLRAQAAVDAKWYARMNAANRSYSPSAVPAALAPTLPASARADAWRYVWQDSRWWYYRPDAQWLVYQNDAWSLYTGPDASAAR